MYFQFMEIGLRPDDSQVAMWEVQHAVRSIWHMGFPVWVGTKPFSTASCAKCRWAVFQFSGTWECGKLEENFWITFANACSS